MTGPALRFCRNGALHLPRPKPLVAGGKGSLTRPRTQVFELKKAIQFGGFLRRQRCGLRPHQEIRHPPLILLGGAELQDPLYRRRPGRDHINQLVVGVIRISFYRHR